MSQDKKLPLMDALDLAASKLLLNIFGDDINEEKYGVLQQPVAVNEQVAIFNAAVRYLAVKHKVNPDDEGSGLDDIIKELHGGKTPRGSSNTESASSAAPKWNGGSPRRSTDA